MKNPLPAAIGTVAFLACIYTHAKNEIPPDDLFIFNAAFNAISKKPKSSMKCHITADGFNLSDDEIDLLTNEDSTKEIHVYEKQNMANMASLTNFIVYVTTTETTMYHIVVLSSETKCNIQSAGVVIVD